MKNIRTDLAVEALSGASGDAGELPGVEAREETVRGFPLTRVEVRTEEGARRLGKPRGVYLTLALDAWVRRREAAFDDAAGALSDCVRPLLPASDDPPGGPILVAALGNEAVTPDALGPLTARQLCVTRHLLRAMPEALRGLRPVACVAPGVLGTTGIESVELVRTAAAWVEPVCVVAVDALAARSMDRLCTAVQISDAGIVPGSGVGNARAAFDRETLGVPVIAVGVPTVVDAGVLARELTGEAGPPPEGGARMIVTPREIDVRVSDMAKVIGRGLNLAFHDGAGAEMFETLLG